MRSRFILGFEMTVIAMAMLLLSGESMSGQVMPAATRKENRVNLNFHLGSVVVPPDFNGAVRADWNDAWAGYFQSGSRSMRIGWRAGIIERVRDNRKTAAIVWEKKEKTSANSIRLALLRDKDGDILVATIGDVDFDVLLKNDSDEDIFMSLIRSYQKEHCRLCPSLKLKVAD